MPQNRSTITHVSLNKELVKKNLVAFANEITMGIVAPLTLTVLRTTEVCQKQECVHENVITELKLLDQF